MASCRKRPSDETQLMHEESENELETREPHRSACSAFAVGALTACAGTSVPPKALVDARDELTRSKDGVAMQLDPTDVHEAETALQIAEHAFANNPNDPSTNDLALIAHRKALLAESEACGQSMT